MWTPEAITVARDRVAGAPLIGAPPSTRIAVKGPLGRRSAAIPEAASVAVAVRVSGWFDQPLGAPASRVTGSVLSTRRTVSAGAAERTPEPETATACR